MRAAKKSASGRKNGLTGNKGRVYPASYIFTKGKCEMKLRDKVKKYTTVPHRWFYGLLAIGALDAIDACDYLVHAACTLARNWETKAAVAATAATILDSVYTQLTGVYGTIATAYFWIITMDIITKWLACGNQHLLARNMRQEQITTMDKVGGIILAFNDGELTSRLMLGGFVSKFVLFGIGVFTAVKLDKIFHVMNIPLPLTILTFVLGYFCYHEAISIAENLRDAGNSHMDKLVELLNTNIFNKLKR